MPYNRYNKKPFKKSYKKRYNSMTPKQVASIARSVGRQDKPVREIRFWNSATPTLTTSTLGASFSTMELSAIPQGDDLDERTGNKIYMSGVKTTITFKNFSAQSRFVRVSVVKNRNVAGDLLDTSASWSDIYQGVNYNDLGASVTLLDAQAPLNRDVLEVFYDKVFTLAPVGNERDNYQFTKYIPINRKFEYGDEGNPTTTLSGQLYLIIHLIKPDFTVGNSDATDVVHMSRVFYKDA